jgi:hypothetical protein
MYDLRELRDPNKPHELFLIQASALSGPIHENITVYGHHFVAVFGPYTRARYILAAMVLTFARGFHSPNVRLIKN